MKTLAWFLTAAAILIGADVYTASSDAGSSTETTETATLDDRPVTLQGGGGWPTPPSE